MQEAQKMILDFHKILSDFNNNYLKDYYKPLFKNLEALQNMAYQGCKVEKDKFSYAIDDFVILLPEFLSHTIPSSTHIQEIEIAVSVKNIEIQKVEKNIKNPILRLDSFDIVLNGQTQSGKKLIASWHLDKRIQSANYTFQEPEFHFSFGGKKMEEAHESREYDFDALLLMSPPRLMHPPMGIILGIDFVLRNYVGTKYCKALFANPNYLKIIKNMKALLWKPYALALAKNLLDNNEWQNIGEYTFDNDFGKSILGN